MQISSKYMNSCLHTILRGFCRSSSHIKQIGHKYPKIHRSATDFLVLGLQNWSAECKTSSAKNNGREWNGYIHIIQDALYYFIFMLGSKFVQHLEPYSHSTFFFGLQGFQILMLLTLGSENQPFSSLFLLQTAQVEVDIHSKFVLNF